MATPSGTPKNKNPVPPNEGDELMAELRKYLMLMAILAATVTYVAGLNPPGGVWAETADGHLTGNQILVVTHHARYNAFYYSNVIAFMASVVVILLLLLERSVQQVRWLFSLRIVLVLDLLALMVAYAAGASRGMFATIFASLLVSAVSLYAGNHIFRYLRDGGPRGAAGKTPVDKDDKVTALSKILIVFALFAATVTYTAGLSPPGGFWPDSKDGHRAGDPVLQDFHHWFRFMAFFVFNSAAFAASLVAVMLLTTMKSKEESFDKGLSRFPAAYWLVLVAMLDLLLAYGLGSSRRTRSSFHILCVQLPLLVACILLQFLFQKFCWKSCREFCLEHACKLGELVKGDLVLLLATLAATIMYQAGMNPPGGFWPDVRDGHKGGSPVLLTTNAERYKVFFYCNSVALVASVVVIAMLLSKHLRGSVVHRLHALEATMILDLLSLVAAYAAGCCRDVGTSLHVITLAAGVLVYILIHMIFFTLEHSDEEDKRMKKKRKLLLLAILAATISYQAGLTPPGAFWSDGEAAGYAVLATNYPGRYTAFFYCNATSFVSSIAVIILLVNPNLYKFGIKCYVLYVCAVAGLFGLTGAYAAGSSRHMRTSVVVMAVLIVVSVFIMSLLAALWYLKSEEDVGKKKEAKSECNTEPTTVEEEALRKNEDSNREPTTSTSEDEAAVSHARNTTNNKEEEGEQSSLISIYTSRKYMMMVAILVAGVTYQAGLTPPGGVWPDSTDGHAAGDPVLRDSNKRRYHLFFDSNSVCFLMSLLVILLILLDEPLFGRKEEGLPMTQASEGEKKNCYSGRPRPPGLFGMGCEELLQVAQTSLLLALLGLLFGYVAGCSREWETSGYVFVLAGGVLLYIVIHVLISCHDKRPSRKDDGKCTDDNCNCKCHGKDVPQTATPTADAATAGKGS
ncbi:unnamed protein product [Alopecurus aequalis]